MKLFIDGTFFLFMGFMFFLLNRRFGAFLGLMRKLRDEIREDIHHLHDQLTSAADGESTAGMVEACKVSAEVCDRQEALALKSLEVWRKLEAATPEEELWKLTKAGSSAFTAGLVPLEHLLPSEMLARDIEFLHCLRRQHHPDTVEVTDAS